MNTKQLPEGWRMVKFGEMAKHISKRVEPRETDLDIYVGLEHLDPDSLRIKRHGVPGDVDGQKLLVKKGQIIFGKRRAYQRKLGVADWDCICSAHAMVLEANPETVLPDFLPFFMQSDVFMNRAVAVSEGSLSPTIKWKILANQSFPLPSINKQNEILIILKQAELLKQTYEETIVSGFLLKNLILKTIGNDGDLVSVEDLMESVTSGSRGWAQYYSEIGDTFIRITNMNRGKIDLDFSDTKYVEIPNGETEGARTRVFCGDILISITADLGLVAFIDDNFERRAYVNQHIALLRPNREKVIPVFLAYLFISPYGQKLLASLNDGGAKAGISLRNINKIKIPDINRQNIISKLLTKTDNCLLTLEMTYANQVNLSKCVLSKSLRDAQLFRCKKVV